MGGQNLVGFNFPINPEIRLSARAAARGVIPLSLSLQNFDVEFAGCTTPVYVCNARCPTHTHTCGKFVSGVSGGLRGRALN